MSTSRKIETEAKFSVPNQATFEQLQALARLGHFELKPGKVETIVDRYLDTADKQLFRQVGFACRIRQAPDKQTVTLKALTPAEGNIHRRQQIETSVSTAVVLSELPVSWPESQVRELLLEWVGQKPLVTLFTLYQTRHTFEALWQNLPVIEFSLDEVSLRADAVDYYELEAELIEDGTEADLARFIQALQAVIVLPAQTQSKFERAWSQIVKEKGE